MNKFMGSGRLTRDAMLNGGARKALKFTIAARYGYDKENKKDRVEFVPCVLFDPGEKLIDMMTTNGKGMQIELEGRIKTSKYERDGKNHYSTEVIADKRSFKIISNHEELPL